MGNRGANQNMGLIRNNQAMFFTIMVILLLSLVMVSFNFYLTVHEREAISKRISTMDNFLFSIEQNLEREIYAFGFRVIFLAGEEITSSGNYISDLDGFVEEAFFDGTVNGVSSEILVGVNYNDLINNLNQRAAKVNVILSFSNPEVSMTQEDPWNVVVTVSFNFTMYDKANLSSWSRRQEIKSVIEVENFEDPIYLLNTNGKITNKINKTIYEPFEGDVSDLTEHVNNQYYIASSSAPSFLNRLEGDFSANESGIESLVYLPELSTQGITIKSKSVVDYIYFSSNNPSSQTVSGMPSWFKLDSDHLSVYGIS